MSMFLDPDFAEICETLGIDPLEELEDDDMGVAFPQQLRTHGKKTTRGALPQFHGGHNGYQPTHTVAQSTYKPCDHIGDTLVFEADGKQLYAANMRGLDEYSGNWDLIIDLAQILTEPTAPTPFVRAKSAKRFGALQQYMQKAQPPKAIPSEVLALQWPDMSAPPVTLDFWTTLWGMLPKSTVVACHGGHGRTGTCLASLLIAAGFTYANSVACVRNKHCKKAIESHSQELYLHRLYLAKLEQDGQQDTEAYKLVKENPPKQAEARKGFIGGSHGNYGASHKVYTCVNPNCTIYSCTIASHQGWAEIQK